jgi:chromosome segregation ATPase
MMKRLLRRANALNPSESDDFADEQPAESAPAAPAAPSAELEAKLEQMTQKLGQMAVQLNQTQAQLRQIQQANRRTEAASASRIEDLNAIEIRVNASLTAQQERLKIQSNKTDESLRLVISSGEQMATRLSKTEKTLQ